LRRYRRLASAFSRQDGVYPLAKFVRIIKRQPDRHLNVLRLFAERLATEAPIGEERGVVINTRVGRGLLKARSARSPIRRRRAVSSALRCRRRAILASLKIRRQHHRARHLLHAAA